MRLTKSAALFLATAMLLSPDAVLAVAKIVSSSPAANVTVSKPTKIMITFNEKLIGATVKVELFMTGMPAGMSHGGEMDHSKMDHSKMNSANMTDHAPMKVAATSQLGKDGMSVTLMPKRALTTGKFKVVWTAAGADKKAMKGEFSFTVK